MTASAFSDFVKRKTTESRVIDWDAKRDLWLYRLNGLYTQINGYLKEFVEQQQIQITRYEMLLKEDYIGEYLAGFLKIEIGSSIVHLKPIGTLLIGGAGRVDMEGPGATVRIVLAPSEVDEPHMRVVISNSNGVEQQVDAEVDWIWKIVNYSPRMRYVLLDERTFHDALMAAADA